MTTEVTLFRACYTVGSKHSIDLDLLVDPTRNVVFGKASIQDGPELDVSGSYLDGPPIAVSLTGTQFLIKLVITSWDNGGTADYSYVYNGTVVIGMGAKVTHRDC